MIGSVGRDKEKGLEKTFLEVGVEAGLSGLLVSGVKGKEILRIAKRVSISIVVLWAGTFSSRTSLCLCSLLFILCLVE